MKLKPAFCYFWSYALLALLFTLIAALATYAAPLPPMPIAPMPVVRPAPLLSPKHASQPKVTAMVRSVIPGTTPAPVMTATIQRVDGTYGNWEFTGSILKRAGQSMVFEVSPSLAGGYVHLATFGPEPYDTFVFGALYSFSEINFMRAKATAESSATSRVIGASIGINPELKGAKAWSVRK